MSFRSGMAGFLARLCVYGALAAAAVFASRRYDELARQAARPDPPIVFLKQTSGLMSEPLYIILKKQGIKEPQLSRIIAKAKTLKDPRTFKPKDEYMVVLSTAGAFHRLLLTQGTTRYYVAGVKKGALAAGKINMKVLERVRTAAGVIKNSLWDSMTASGLSPQLVMQFADAFAWNIDFLTETRAGDRYAVAWNEKYVESGAVTEQTITAAYYYGGETGRKKAFQYKGDYYDETGDILQRMFLRAPLMFSKFRISSTFTNRRFHPVLRIFRPHLGIDYAAPSGTPVSSVATGRVIFAGWKGGFGRYVEVKHDRGYVTCYGHLRGYAKAVSEGSRVKQGQVIGYVGASGLATGPHLDFRVRENGTYLNFLKIKNRSAGGLPKSALPLFQNAVKGLAAELDRKIAAQR